MSLDFTNIEPEAIINYIQDEIHLNNHIVLVSASINQSFENIQQQVYARDIIPSEISFVAIGPCSSLYLMGSFNENFYN